MTESASNELSAKTDGYASGDPGGDAIKRCAEFVDDIIAVCRKHRVLITVDDDTDLEDATFEEHSTCPSGTSWVLGIGDLENNVRLALWNELNGVESDA